MSALHLPRAPIVIISDVLVYASLLQDILQDEGYPAITYDLHPDACRFVSLMEPDLLILDLQAKTNPALSIAFLESLRHDPHCCAMAILVCTPIPNADIRRLIQPYGSMLAKPFALPAFLAAVDTRLDRGAPANVRSVLTGALSVA